MPDYKNMDASEMLFGEKSYAEVRCSGLGSYLVVRDVDRRVLAKGLKFKKYRGQTIRTMYTGESYGTGDWILENEQRQCIHTLRKAQ